MTGLIPFLNFAESLLDFFKMPPEKIKELENKLVELIKVISLEGFSHDSVKRSRRSEVL